MSQNRLNHFSNKGLFFIAILIIFAYVSPYFILGENTHIRVHDNLDSNIVWYKLLAESGQIFSSPNTLLPSIINGLPRSALPSAFDGVVWLYVLFTPFVAYAISQTVMRIVAFIGMYYLLQTFIIHTDKSSTMFIQIGVSVCFALLPFWPSGMLSIAGLPLATYLFLTIRQKQFHTSKWCWILLFIIPFFSNFILTFFFYLSGVSLLFLYDCWKEKKINLAFLIAIITMISIYLLKNYMLLYSMFVDSGSPSHRKELDLGYNNFEQTLQLLKKNFIYSHTHALDLHENILLPIVLFSILISLIKKQHMDLLIKLLALNILFSVLYSFWYWEGLRIIKDHIDFFNEFNFGRFHLLRPFLWYLMFAIALSIIWRNGRWGKLIVSIALIVQVGQLFLLTEEIKYRQVGTPTFAEFYDEDLFNEIKQYIGEPPDRYRIASLALHPSIAQYNGFYTLDTYNNTIPLYYKHEFRPIIAPELAKNKTLQKYYDTWGSRLYLYSDDIGKKYVFSKDSTTEIEHLDLNLEAFKSLGGKYILSGVPIKNAQELGLTFEGSFTTENSYWEIYLYQVP